MPHARGGACGAVVSSMTNVLFLPTIILAPFPSVTEFGFFTPGFFPRLIVGTSASARGNIERGITDAFVGDWQPSEKPFFTGIVTMADEGGKTRYIARALHWTDEDCEQHKQMGFHEGWGKAADQLEALCKKI